MWRTIALPFPFFFAKYFIAKINISVMRSKPKNIICTFQQVINRPLLASFSQTEKETFFVLF